jgi:hypothetical protein
MSIVEVKNAQGAVVWKSPEVDQPLVEVVDNTVKVIEFETGQVVATYPLKPGERVSK